MPKNAVTDYLFHFDAPLERICFNKEIKIAGWLLHRQGLSTHGIRGIVRGALRRRCIFKARRKRSRPLIAAAYPDFPEAAESGFLLELQLPAGRSEVTVQVRDHKKAWQTILVTEIWSLPFSFVSRIGFPRGAHVLETSLTERFAKKTKSITTAAGRHVVCQSRATPTAVASKHSSRRRAQRGVKSRPCICSSRQNRICLSAKLLNWFVPDFGQRVVTRDFSSIKFQRKEPSAGKIQIVVTPHEFFNLFLAKERPREKIQRLANHLFLLGTEQPESEWFYNNLVMAPYARAMVDIHLSGVAGYRAAGLRCFHLPLGYHPMLEQGDRPETSERDVDVCMLAAMTDRREEFSLPTLTGSQLATVISDWFRSDLRRQTRRGVIYRRKP